MNPIGWFEIYVKDMPRAKAFYEHVFGTSLNKIPSPQIEMWGFPAPKGSDGALGALVHVEGYSPEGNGVLLYFACEDCSQEESRVAQAGGAVHRPKMQMGEYGFVTLVVDTEGNMIGLTSAK